MFPIKELGRLYKYIALMNDAGMDLLVEAANDIISHEKYRQEDKSLITGQVNRDIKSVLDIVQRNYELQGKAG